MQWQITVEADIECQTLCTYKDPVSVNGQITVREGEIYFEYLVDFLF